jgi:VWFA-related protein
MKTVSVRETTRSSTRLACQNWTPFRCPGEVRAVLGLALLLCVASGAHAKPQDAGTARQPFSDVIDVRVVEVEAVVTGRDGSRIPGLRASDFRLLVDGQEVPIGYFEEVRLDLPEPSRATGRSFSRTRSTVTGDGSTPRVNYLVFIDDYFTHRGRRNRLLQNLVDDVRGLGPGERMAVVRYEGKALEVISDWTDSKDQLTRALEDARRRTPAELVRRARHSGVGRLFSARLQSRHIRQVTDAMAAAMRALSDVEGRKLFLPVTTGWNFDPSLRTRSPFERVSAENAGFVSESSPFSSLSELTEISGYLNVGLLRPITDAANLLGYTIYPMDVHGPGNVELTSLWTIARDTGGGLATRGASAPSPLQPVREDIRSYYVLAFTPDWAWNDRRHKVEVEVLLEGAKVRHRRDFRDLSRSTQRALRVEEALLVDLTEGDLAVRLGEARKVKRSVIEVPVELEIPMDWVTVVPDGEQWRSSLEVRIAALDKWGDRSEMPVIPVTLSGPKPEPGSHSIYETRIHLRDIRQRLVISLTDRFSGEARIAAIDLDP